jgi:Flp pilus assembly protein TadD
MPICALNNSSRRATCRGCALRRCTNRSGHPELALRAWQMAALRNERNGLTRERLGYAWLQQGELGRAEVEFTRTLQLDANAWRAAMGLGLVAERRLDVATARLRYDQALGLQQQGCRIIDL